MTVRLVIDGEPRGKGRHRSTRTGHTYQDDKTASAEGVIQHAWDHAGRPRLDGPLVFRVEAVMSRPAGHYNQSGLSAQGRRAPWPCKVPDVDNVIKLAQDSLCRLAFHDDAQIVHVEGWKRWCNPGETPCTVIELDRAPVADGHVQAVRAA